MPRHRLPDGIGFLAFGVRSHVVLGCARTDGCGAWVAAHNCGHDVPRLSPSKTNESENPNGYAQIIEDGFREQNVEFDTEISAALTIYTDASCGKCMHGRTVKNTMSKPESTPICEGVGKADLERNGKLEQPMLQAMLADALPNFRHISKPESCLSMIL